MSVLLYGCTTWTVTKRLEKKARRELHKDAPCNLGKILEEVTPPKKNTSYTVTYLPSHKLSKYDGQELLDKDGEAETNS